MLEIRRIDIGTSQIAYNVFGTKKIDVVIEMGLGTCIGEWWHIATQLSAKHSVLLYERAGYGSSGKSTLQRTPQNISFELFNLLEQLPHEPQVVLLAHSQGGLYAQQFVRSYPHLIKSLILLDPLSANDNYFKSALTKREYRKSGVNKFSNLNIQLFLAKLHLGNVIQNMMRNAPPFYYFNEFSNEATDYILSALVKPIFYQTAMQEYLLSHDDATVSSLKSRDGFPNIPIHLITHTSEMAVKEIVDFGGLSYEAAWKIENIWQGLMREYLLFSDKSDFMQANHGSHYLHLTEADLVYKVMEL